MMALRRLFILLILIISSIFGMAETHADTKQYALDVDRASRTFLVHVPTSMAPGQPAPLVIALHGGGTSGNSMESFSGLSEAGDKYGFVVVYPNGSGRFKRVLTWNSGRCCAYAHNHNVDDVAFLSRLIDHMIGQYGIDPSRVYVTGISNGAMMAYRLAAEIPDKIAALAAVAGTLDVDPNAVRAPMPILHFHGTDDRFVPFQGGQGPRTLSGVPHTSVMDTIEVWVRVNKATPNPIIEELPDRSKDGTHIVKYTYATRDDKEDIVLYKIIGGGHTWPGQPHLKHLLGVTTTQISANDLMWKFFSAHPKNHAVKDE